MFVTNGLEEIENGLYELENKFRFSYSDGSNSEKYLNAVFGLVEDLSSSSIELESYIIDWPSEYHLSASRSHLLKGFDFERDSCVLEVGCGCGAITRYLGENFTSVHSVEGSKTRASLARARTRDLKNVHIVSAPFDVLNFKQKYDYIFCIGVLEYARSFVEGDDPYKIMIAKMKDLLKDSGTLVIAIENQFGLKYFNGDLEDHTATKYDGLEGYHNFPNKARTFGYNELRENLGKYFSKVDFYFPYPDYKLPNLLISENIFGKVSLSGLYADSIRKNNTHHRKQVKNNFIDELVFDELDRNNLVRYFANSFLILCDNEKSIFKFTKDKNRSKWGATLYSYDEPDKLKVLSLLTDNSRDFFSSKFYINQKDNSKIEIARDSWLQGKLFEQALNESILCRVEPYKLFFEYLARYYEFLKERSILVEDGVLSGADVDLLLRNLILNGDTLEVIDREHDFGSNIKIDVVYMRAIYYYLLGLRGKKYLENLPKTSTKISFDKSIKKIMLDISKELNVPINSRLIEEFCAIESQFLYNIHGGDLSHYERLVKKHLKLNLVELKYHTSIKIFLKRLFAFFYRKAKYKKVVGSKKRILEF